MPSAFQELDIVVEVLLAELEQLGYEASVDYDNYEDPLTFLSSLIPVNSIQDNDVYATLTARSPSDPNSIYEWRWRIHIPRWEDRYLIPERLTLEMEPENMPPPLITTNPFYDESSPSSPVPSLHDDDDVTSQPPLSLDTMLLVIDFRKTDAEDTMCSICYETVVVDKQYLVNPCKHIYHYACLNQWCMHGHDTCPMCRGYIAFVSTYGDL